MERKPNKQPCDRPPISRKNCLAEKCVYDLTFIDSQFPIYKNRVHVIEEISQMPSLEKALQFRGKQFFQFYAANLRYALLRVGIWVNEIAGLHRQVEPIEFRNIETYADRDLFRVS